MHRHTVGAVALSLLATILVYWPLLTDYWTILDDMRLAIFWMVQYQDPSLFQNDPLTRYSSLPGLASIGMTSLYKFSSNFMSPLLLSRLLPLFLLPFTIWCVFRIGWHIGGRTSAWTLTVMVLVVFFGKDLYAGGLARAFYHTLLIHFAWALMRQRYRTAGILLVLTAICYPQAMLIASATWLIYLWMEQAAIREKPFSTLLPPTLAFMACAAIILPVYLFKFNDSFGTLISVADARSMPEFSSLGRYKYFQGHMLLDMFFGQIGIGLIESTFVLLGLAGWITWANFKNLQPLPTVFQALLLGSLVCHIAARVTMFHLHLPSRYMYTLPVILAVFAAVNMETFTRHIISRWKRFFTGVQPWHIMVVLLALLAVSNVRRYRKEISRCDIPLVCEFLATLPKNAVIAGWPKDMDWVPLFSQRIVLINYEMSGIMHYGLLHVVKERTQAIFKAYYASDAAPLLQLHDQFGVTHFVVRKAMLTENFIRTGKFYYQPYNDWLQDWLKPDYPIFLRNPPPHSVIWENDTHLVIDLKLLKEVQQE